MVWVEILRKIPEIPSAVPFFFFSGGTDCICVRVFVVFVNEGRYLKR